MVAFRFMAALPVSGALFTAWLTWQLHGLWDRLDTTDQVLAVLLVAATLGFSVLACATMRAAITVRHAPQPGTAAEHASRGAAGDAP